MTFYPVCGTRYKNLSKGFSLSYATKVTDVLLAIVGYAFADLLSGTLAAT